MLNDRQLKSLKPKERQFDLIDSGGLCARVHPSGNITFLIRFRYSGKQYRKKIGTYPTMSIKNARLKSQEYLAMLDQGINPIENEQRKKSERDYEPTVAEFIEEFYQSYLLSNLKRPDKPMYLLKADVIPAVGEWKISDVDRRDLVLILDKIVKRGAPVQANRTLSAMKKLFSYAVERGVIKDPAANPALIISRQAAGGKETSKKRFLTYPEIRTVWNSLDDAPFHEVVSSIIRLMLLTGLRVDEVAGAEKSEINLKTMIWTIPAIRTKTTSELKVPLTDLMIDDIRRLEFFSGKSKYLCRSPLARFDGPIGSDVPAKNLKRYPDHFRIPAWTPHDLRRTVSTHLNELVEPWVVEKILNHQMVGVMAVYNQAEYMDKRIKAMRLWTKKIKQVTSSDNVIPIKKLE